MPVTILVTIDELPVGMQTYRSSESQSEPLLTLEDKYQAIVAERLPQEQRNRNEDSRHIWYNGQFQLHQNRYIYHIADTPTIALNFRRDSYLVSTPRHPDMDRTIDPELTIEQVLDWLQERKLIGSTCCYEVVNNRNVVLKTDKTLYEQGVLPCVDPLKKQESHLRVRMQRSLMRNAYILLFLCAIAGGLLGWAISRKLGS